MAEQEIDDRSFFGRLKKLFASNAIVTVDKDGKRIVVDIEDRQSNTNFVNLRYDMKSSISSCSTSNSS